MKQLIQNFKTGELKVDDVPPPVVQDNTILIQNYYSVISAGTERSTVSMGKSSLIGKAKQRPEQVKQVIETIKKEGIVSTYQKVQNKLDTPKALGYSTAGKVIAIGKNITDISVGDMVACGGQDIASHAEIISVPRLLCAKIPEGVSLSEASFTTMGAIAMQGVRLCKPELGHKVAVLGMGILGHIAVQLLSASGCDVIALDISEGALKDANQYGASDSFLINDSTVENIITATNGYGVDSVLILAGTSSNAPIELAGEICRRKARVVVTGAVKMDIPRTNYFKKEIEVVISCSYGAGRYDSSYEDHGVDYPYEYVRFTENRNFETFLNLLKLKKISLKYLITHEYSIDDAITAYNLILGKTTELYRGIILKYNQSETLSNPTVTLRQSKKKATYGIGVIGAGSHAQSHLLPALKEHVNTEFISVCTSTGANAKNTANKLNFASCTSDSSEVILHKDVDVVVIATRHDTHANLVIESLKKNKHVFVEKPLAMNETELGDVKIAYESSNSHVMVGFNRRFSILSEELKSFYTDVNEPLCINYRINAGFLPKDHWTQDPVYGGGRIIGEVCHFIDYARFITDSKVSSVNAISINSGNAEITNEDTIAITLTYENGSIAQILYVANGDKSVEKERIEVTGGNRYAVLNDYKELSLTKSGKTRVVKKSDKGQKRCLTEFINTLSNESSLISFDELIESTQVSFDIHKSLKNKLSISYK